MSVAELNQVLALGALVLLVAVVAVRLATRTGMPSLLLYLGLGVLIGGDVLGLSYDNAELTQTLSYAALVLILTEGGISTNWEAIKPAVPAAAVLSTVGVGVSVGVTAVAARFVLDTDWSTAILMGAIVSSTDAAAVFSVLRTLPLPKRLTGLLEAESGFNDAPVVILVVTFAQTGSHPWYQVVGEIVLELGIGAAIGFAVGKVGSWGLRHIALPASGLYPIAVIALCVLAYAAGALGHGSGFLACYVAALILGNAQLPHKPATRGFAEGVGWIAQIGLFVLLGLLVTPHELGGAVVPALVIGTVLLLLARPLSVVVSTTPFRVPWREQVILSWAGLRGAVPIVLATIPIVENVADAERLFNITFVLVIVFTVVQGPTLPWIARKVGFGGSPESSDLGVESAPLEKLRAHLLSVSVPSGSRIHGVEVGELRLPKGAAVTLVVRGAESFVPGPTTVLQRDDDLLVVTTEEVRDATERRLRAVSRGGKLAGWLGERGN
ncbi:potassium/proton antiporter [Yinghuangia seranimata]|uniref:potassium/proton antiporter n=1 Tax=Yinghuangia seranimata TaxID=408067 RepID=UPI00248AAB30|nr:potassium/proton antiporter [Yinghuangia seranimata]MDI2128768.1 potassium/proton antiporter [Yinghuangia seranimata]